MQDRNDLDLMFNVYEAQRRSRTVHADGVRFTVNLPRSFAERIDAEAARKGWTRSRVLRDYVARGMASGLQVPPPEEGGRIIA